jgi:hypothetical protein
MATPHIDRVACIEPGLATPSAWCALSVQSGWPAVRTIANGSRRQQRWTLELYLLLLSPLSSFLFPFPLPQQGAAQINAICLHVAIDLELQRIYNAC